MSTSDRSTAPGTTVAVGRSFRSGIARTLGRRALPSKTQPQSMAELAASDGGTSIPLNRDHHQLISSGEPALPPASAGDARREVEPIFRSQTQMAAIFARAVARGQRNL